jgi:LPS-assembly protein
MNRYSILIALSLLLLLPPFAARGEVKRESATSGPVDITARELKYNREQNIYTAEGDVEMKEGTRLLTADFVLYNDTTKDAFAEGHVIFQDLEDVVHAERMSINTVTKRGTIEKGRVFVKSGNFYVTGNEIEKTGEYTYFLHQGEFTTCGFDHPDWIFKAKDVDLTAGGYATAKDATFSVLGHPLLYLPWGVFPVKNERQSGLLVPTVTSSSFNGKEFEDAYYWAIDKDKDATFYFDWLQDRGVKPGVEYRYAPTETTHGFWYGSIIDDTDYGHTRYQIDGQHQQTFGDINFKADVNHVSDNTYLEDLGATVTDRAQNSLRSVAFAEKPFSGSLLTGEAAYFQDLTQKSNDATEQYLPSLSYFTEYVPLLKQKLYGDLSADLTNFEEGTGDRTTRLTATPTVRVPYSLNGLNFLASAGVTEKSYQTNNPLPGASDTVHHEAATIEGDANAEFLKNTSTSLFDLGQVQSIISPRLTYTYLKNDESLGNVPSIDPSDRTNDANILTYSLNHYFNAVKDNAIREVSLLEIEQTYGLSEKLEPQPFLYYGSGSRLSDIHERFTLFPTTNIWYVNENVFSVHGQGFTSMTNSLHYAFPPFLQVDLSHSYGKEFLEPTTEQISKEASNEVYLNTTLKWRQFDFNYQIWYSFAHPSGVIDTAAAVTYHPSCWSVTFTVTKSVRPNNTSYNISFNLQGMTQKVGSPQATSTTSQPFPPVPQGGSSAPQNPAAPGAAPQSPSVPQTAPGTESPSVPGQPATISQADHVMGS